jgi:hypothetical protein
MQQAAYAQSPSILHGLAGSSPSGYGGGGGSVAGQFYDVARDMMISPTITGMKANSLVIDDQVLDASMIKRMKKMMSGRSK